MCRNDCDHVFFLACVMCFSNCDELKSNFSAVEVR